MALGKTQTAQPLAGAPFGDRRCRFELAARPDSVARARQLTRTHLARLAVCDDTCDTAALVVSELVTNALVHTVSSRIVCDLTDDPVTGRVRIAVCDEGPGQNGGPHPHPARSGDEDHGRGLLLVSAVSTAWGTEAEGHGLLVWAELPRAAVEAAAA
ncbi:ATP-binding protein [Streptomyces boluensis]|uniref:ATP-binding protein n=1 Tax=Streptomyces boluensis TaxID=1775135 RepID=A0A964UTA2_9ACTN|nr:ATP-binding protein [Streptomyces boluensis]NBE53743.1 ATP-binding protein [Streptomyces boluensis]